MRKGNVAAAITLILIGGWFLAVELIPPLKDLAYSPKFWPIPIIGIGVLLAIIALFTWTPQMWIPATIVAGVGSLLYYQNSTGNWESWAYAWALIPGFVGLGLFLAGVFGRKPAEMTAGLWQLAISLILFMVFGSFLGGPALLGKYWPVGLILIGLLVLVRGFTRRTSQ
jgi:hypothetical protein